jgi:diguanylate cyclase (GGDEF)-like protein
MTSGERADGTTGSESLVDLTGDATPADDHAAGRRDLAARRRERAAEQRDRYAAIEQWLATRRDQAATARDHEADRRDRDILSIEALEALDVPAAAIESLTTVRREAASDRRAAAGDRLLAAADRAYADADRLLAKGDREVAARERSTTVFDHLTGAYLRGPGFVEVSREVARAKRSRQPLVLAFVDVDGLKAINDAEGHTRGDEVLRAVGRALRAAVRPYDPVVRYGGDEFICVLPGLDLEEAARRLEAVNVILAMGPARTTVTTGLAELRVDESIASLIHRADAVLYAHRRRQRGTGQRSHGGLDQDRRDAGLSHMALWLRYFELGGMAVPLELEAYVINALRPSPHEHSVIVAALNERFAELGHDPIRRASPASA